MTGEVGIELFGNWVGQGRHDLPIRRRSKVAAFEIDVLQARGVAG